MKNNRWLKLFGLLLMLALLNACAAAETPDFGDAPAATSPPSSVGSQGTNLLRPTPANPEQKVEPTRAITADTVAQQPVLVAASGPQSNSPTPTVDIHRNRHSVYLMVVIRRPE